MLNAVLDNARRQGGVAPRPRDEEVFIRTNGNGLCFAACSEGELLPLASMTPGVLDCDLAIAINQIVSHAETEEGLPGKTMGKHRRDRARDDLAHDHHTTAPIIQVTLPYIEAQLNLLEESLPERRLIDENRISREEPHDAEERCAIKQFELSARWNPRGEQLWVNRKIEKGQVTPIGSQNGLEHCA